MAGKTVSAFADEATARRVEQLTKLEGRSASQIAAAALGYYVMLPAEAHAALRQIDAFGTREDRERLSRTLARHILDAQYDLARRRIVAAMRVEGLEPSASEDDLLEAAVRISRPAGPDSGADRERGHRRPAGEPATAGRKPRRRSHG